MNHYKIGFPANETFRKKMREENFRENFAFFQEQTELSKTMPLFGKKKEHVERVLKDIGMIIKSGLNTEQ